MTQRLILGPAVRAIRESIGVRGSEFATRAGISHSYLVNIEKGVKQPAEDVTRRIATELAVPLDAITYTAQRCSCGVAA